MNNMPAKKKLISDIVGILFFSFTAFSSLSKT
jgi:hypothetical protein